MKVKYKNYNKIKYDKNIFKNEDFNKNLVILYKNNKLH